MSDLQKFTVVNDWLLVCASGGQNILWVLKLLLGASKEDLSVYTKFMRYFKKEKKSSMCGFCM